MDWGTFKHIDYQPAKYGASYYRGGQTGNECKKGPEFYRQLHEKCTSS